VDYKDYYRVLGVPKTADAKAIKSAFRRLAREYHPDVNKDKPNAEARFKEINEAYEVLGDPEKRKKYDELGANWQAYEQWQRSGGQGVPFDFGAFMGGSGGRRGGSRTLSEEELRDLFGNLGGGAAGGAGGFSDFFRTFFDFGGADAGPATGRGRRTAPTYRQAGADVEHEVEITLDEAFTGATRILQLSSPDGGARRLEITLPAGVGDGKRIRYAGQGGPGAGGGPAGDLIVRVKVRPHERFTRDGDDLSLKLTAPLTTMVLGGEIEAPTLAGTRLLRIPPETTDGRRFRLSGQGMPRFGRDGQRGDLYVEVHAQLPHNLSRRQRELFEELARLEQAGESSAAD
jgi:DnaJ-class molecular chaperone